MFKALELFSGIGAFAEAAEKLHIQVVAAYDQDPRANETYKLNHGIMPSSRNLDTVSSAELPPADLWWMSPPCQPYSVRGNQKGLQDPRARSLVNLLSHVKNHNPKAIILENVLGFRDSDAHRLVVETLSNLGYQSRLVELSPTDFGIPMRRPRLYLVATASGINFKPQDLPTIPAVKLKTFIKPEFDEALVVRANDFARYCESLHVIKPADEDAYATCFTSGYWKSFKSSGTFLQICEGKIRRFSPEEIVSLMGFSPQFAFPNHLSMSAKLHLAGNTVDVRAIEYMLNGLSNLD